MQQVDLSYTPISGYSEGLRPAPVDVKFERAEEDYMMVYTVRYIPSLPGKYTIDFKVGLQMALIKAGSSSRLEG